MNICEQLELVVGNDQLCHCARLKVWLNAQFASELFAVASGVWQCGLIFGGEAIPLHLRRRWSSGALRYQRA